MRVPLFRKIYSLILVISGYVYILIWFRTSGHTWSQLTSSQPLLLVLFCHHLHKCTGLHLFVHIIFNIVHYSGPYCILACMVLPQLSRLQRRGLQNGHCSSRLATSPVFDLIWLGLGCSLTDLISLKPSVTKLEVYQFRNFIYYCKYMVLSCNFIFPFTGIIIVPYVLSYDNLTELSYIILWPGL